MDSFYIDVNGQDSRQCSRSRSNSHLETTNERFQSLNIINSSHPPRSLSQFSSSTKHSFEPSDEAGDPVPSSFISAPVPQQATPFPILNQDDFDWTFNQTKETPTSAPLLRLDPAEPYSVEQSDRRSPFNPSQSTDNMSTVGIQQYDSRLDAGFQGIRQSYTWPNFDMSINQQFFQVSSPNLSASMTPYEEPKLMPAYPRSISSSPPSVNFTPEQRELKRQRDIARRDSKSRIRRDRSTSNPYVVSQHGSPNLVPGTLPEYTNSLSPSPLLSQASPAMSSTSFLAPFSTQIGGDGGQSDIYAPVYTMGPSDFTPPAYNIPYSDPLAILPSQSYIPRPHSLSTSSNHQVYQPQESSHHHPHQISNTTTTTAKLESGEHIRLLPGRPKPQCWEHGCNGRQFSTFSNLLRHQREKSGAATKSSCPHCGAEFTRTTARNGHMAHEKCKQQRRNS